MKKTREAGEALVISAELYDPDPTWWEAHALLAGCRLTVQRGEGRGWSDIDPDGGYGYVCTRRDLAGPSAW